MLSENYSASATNRTLARAVATGSPHQWPKLERRQTDGLRRPALTDLLHQKRSQAAGRMEKIIFMADFDCQRPLG